MLVAFPRFENNITSLENNTIDPFNNFVIFCSDKSSDLITPKTAKKCPKMFFSKHSKSKTPLITLIKQLNFFVGYAFFWCLFCFFKHFLILTSMLTSIFGLTSIFLTSYAQKFKKMQFLKKVPKKYSKNGVVSQFLYIISKVMPKLNKNYGIF